MSVRGGRLGQSAPPSGLMMRVMGAIHSSGQLWAVVGLCVCRVDARTAMPHGDSHGASLRVRSGHLGHDQGGPGLRCISACAEWTRLPTTRTAAASVHLCACGVCEVLDHLDLYQDGASLRVRSRWLVEHPGDAVRRCISARAEWTTGRPGRRARSSVHLCVCGVDAQVSHAAPGGAGSSLRVRSGLLLTRGCVVALPLRDVGAGWAARGVCPAFRAGDA